MIRACGRAALTFALPLLAVAEQAYGAQEADSAATPESTTRPPPVQAYRDWTRPGFPPAEFVDRRARLAARLAESGGGILLVTSADGSSHGETFRQRDDFHYLTGLEVPSSVLTLDSRTGRAVLYTPRQDFRFQSASRPNDFPGRPLADDPDVAAAAGLAHVRPASELQDTLTAWGRAGKLVRFNPGRPGVLRRVETSLIPEWEPDLLTLFHLQNVYPRLRLVSAFDPVARTRMIKSPAEIERLRRATELTGDAIRATAARVRDGVTERELEATFEAACKRGGAQRVAFAPIVKSGPNSLWPWRILAAHYDRRNRTMHDGELVILDVGCDVDHYVSDVGRTLPVSGRFSEGQRALLEMEVAIADAILAEVRPGVTLAGITDRILERIPPDHRPFMQTGSFFGHHIGLASGDPALADIPLEPGMVFTIEPWYYNHELRVAVFTEDVILVTEDGAERLTSGLPRRPERLEALVPVPTPSVTVRP